MARRFNVPAMAIAVGTVCGAAVLLLTWLNWITGGIVTEPYGWFRHLVRGLSSLYPWYGPSFFGGIWGGICGFIDGAVFGSLVTLIYNRLATPVDEMGD